MTRRWKEEKGELVRSVDWVDAAGLEGDTGDREPGWPTRSLPGLPGTRGVSGPGRERKVPLAGRARGGGGAMGAPSSRKTPAGATGPEEVKERAWFAVQVVDVDGQPIEGLRVTLEAGLPHALRTGPDGIVRVESVDVQHARLTVDSVPDAKALLRSRRASPAEPASLEGPHVTTRRLVGERVSLALEPRAQATLVLAPAVETVWLRLDIDPDDDDNQDDRFTLSADDGSYSQTLRVCDDKVDGDDCVDLEFTGVDPECRYSLQIDPGDRAPYYVFRDVPFAELDAGADGDD